VDNLCVEIGHANPSELRRRVEEVDGVIVELVRSVSVPPSPVDALELASSLAENDDLRIQILVDGLPLALGAEWAMALELQDDSVELVHASSGAPSPPAGTVPWMPLEGSRRLAVSPLRRGCPRRGGCDRWMSASSRSQPVLWALRQRQWRWLATVGASGLPSFVNWRSSRSSRSEIPKYAHHRRCLRRSGSRQLGW
jgi:hypothetical protein